MRNDKHLLGSGDVSDVNESTGPSIPTEWRIGDTILGVYEVVGVLGEGGFGKVYRVHHRGWNADLAVKTLRSELAKDEAERASFIRECNLWVDLGLHPNIVSCYYVRELGGLPRVFAEYMDRGSLRSLLKKGALDWPDILDIGIQALDGLDYAHEKRLIHLDMKPENLLLSSEGAVKVTDFGLASALTVVGGGTSDSPTGTTTVRAGMAGTPAYMPPEQWDPSLGDIGPHSDIYAFGVMLYEMVCGRRPFDEDGMSISALRDSHIRRSPASPRELRPDVSQSLSYAILRCLEKDPKKRFASCVGLRELLVQVYQNVTGQQYMRQRPHMAALRGAALNNRGASFVDLGDISRAISTFEEALSLDPQQLEATYNRGVILWRQGKLTDMELLNALESIRVARAQDWEPHYLTALVHLERGDLKSAVALLEKAIQLGTPEPRAHQLLQSARERVESYPPVSVRLDKSLTPGERLALSPDGSKVLWVTGNKVLHLINLRSGGRPVSYEGLAHDISFVAFHPDGRRAVTVGYDSTICEWDLDSGRHRVLVPTSKRESSARNKAIVHMALSPDGSHLLSANRDSEIYHWDLAIGACSHGFPHSHQHTGKVTFLAYLADGEHVMSAGDEGVLKIWSLKTGEVTKEYTGLGAVVAVSMDGNTCISGGDLRPRVYDLTDESERDEYGRLKPVFKLRGHSETIEYNGTDSVYVSEDGKWGVTSGTDDELVIAWDLRNGRCLRTLDARGKGISTLQVRVSLDRRWILVTISDEMKLFDMDSALTDNHWPLEHLGGMRISRPIPARASITAGDYVAKAIRDAKAAIERLDWSEAGRVILEARSQAGFERDPELLALQRRISTHGRCTGLRGAWRINAVKGQRGYMTDVDVSSDGSVGVSGHEHGAVYLYDLRSGKKLGSIKTGGSTDHGASVCLCQDGKSLLTGAGLRIRKWDLTTGECIVDLDPQHVFDKEFGKEEAWSTGELEFTARQMAFARSGRWALSAHYGSWISGESKILRLWDIDNGTIAWRIKGHNEEVTCVDLSSDGSLGASGSKDRKVRIWDLAKRKCIRVLNHSASVSAVAIAPDKRRLLSGTDDGVLTYWDITNGGEIKRLTHGQTVMGVVFTPDGKYAISRSYEQTKMWDLNEGRVIWSLEHEFSTGEGCVAVSTDGSRLVFGINLGLETWNLDWEYDFGPE